MMASFNMFLSSQQKAAKNLKTLCKILNKTYEDATAAMKRLITRTKPGPELCISDPYTKGLCLYLIKTHK